MHCIVYAGRAVHMRISIHIMHRVMHRLAAIFSSYFFVMHSLTRRIYTLCPFVHMQRVLPKTPYFRHFFDYAVNMHKIYIHETLDAHIRIKKTAIKPFHVVHNEYSRGFFGSKPQGTRRRRKRRSPCFRRFPGVSQPD